MYLIFALVVTLVWGAATPIGAEPEPRERVTNADFPTQLRPEPDSLQSLCRIPTGTTVTVLDMRMIQLERFKENWYQVEYQGTLGWVRGDDLEGESAEKTYSVSYQAPDFLTSATSPGGISF